MSATWSGEPRYQTRADRSAVALDEAAEDVPMTWLERVAEVLGGTILVLVMVYALAGWITEPDWHERSTRPAIVDAP